MNKPSLLRRIFAGIWNTITRIRVALSNILFLLMLAFIYFVCLGGTPQPLPERAALTPRRWPRYAGSFTSIW